MAVTSRYSNTYTRDVVTVKQMGAIGAVCETSYGAEINVNWGANLPSPVPQIGDRWYVQRISPSKWSFESKITGNTYSMMRYSIELDMSNCIGRERSVIDDIKNRGITEVYLTVAESSVVYWDSEVAKNYGLFTCDVDGKPFDYVQQVVNRCLFDGISVVFVIDCDLWSDIDNETHNYYQQVRLPDSYKGSMGWYVALSKVWDDLNNYTWDNVKRAKMVDSDDSVHVPTWSFVTAKAPVLELVSELYEKYSETVRGICFRNWCIDGAYADVSDFTCGAYESNNSRTLVDSIVGSLMEGSVLESRSVARRFYGDLQRGFVSSIKDIVGNWPVSVIVPTKQLCVMSERSGGFDTWLSDNFSSYGWSQVGCLLDYSKSIDRAAELRSFEFLVASLTRFGRGATPLYRIDVSASSDYSGLFNVLAKYNVTNVLIDDYEHLRLLSDEQSNALSNAMNTASVTPTTDMPEFGFLLSSNSRDVAFHDDFDVNRYLREAQDFCSVLMDKLPHRLRILYDSDIDKLDSVVGLSAIVLFHSLNMSNKSVEQVSLSICDSRNIVVIGRCGMYNIDSMKRREDIPFLGKFGEVDYGVMAYEGQVTVRAGRIGAFDNVYVFDGECPGMVPTRKTKLTDDVDAVGYNSKGENVVLPIYKNNRSFIVSIDVLGESSMYDMASEMVLVAIGRDA